MDVPQGLSVGGGLRASHTLASLHRQRGRCQTFHLTRDSRVKPTGRSLSCCQHKKPEGDCMLMCFPILSRSYKTVLF